MHNPSLGLVGLAVSLSFAGCAVAPSLPITTGSLPTLATPSSDKSAKPVHTAKATRMYNWAAFKEKDCIPIQPVMSITQPPAKGRVTFLGNENMAVQHSASGKCVGQTMPSTGVYYTADSGQQGADQFTVNATTESGQVLTRTFRVNIVERSQTYEIEDGS